MGKEEEKFEIIESAKAGKLQIAGIVSAIAILAGMFLIPVGENFPVPARNTLGVLLAVIVLLVTEALPLGIVCLMSAAFLYFFRCTDSVQGAFSGYMNPTLFFILASYGISSALTKVSVTRRFLLTLMRKFGQNTRRLMLAIMLVTCLLSSVISNVAAAAVFIPMILEFLDAYDSPEELHRTARAYMISLPVASMIGGMMTPAGSALNVLAVSLLEKNTGETIPFVHWMLFGIPLACAALPFAWFICVRIFKPAPLSEEKIQAYIRRETGRMPEKMGRKEKYVLAVLVSMMALWILSSWVPFLQIAAVTLLGLSLFFLPGKLHIMSWRDYTKSISFEAFVLMGSMISIGSCISSSGLSDWMSGILFPASFPASPILGIGFLCILIFLMLIPIPVAPALISMLAAPVIGFSGRIGLPPALAVAALGLCANNCYLLPLDTVPLMTFTTGSYKMFDMPKATVWIQLLIVALASLWLPAMGKLLGYF